MKEWCSNTIYLFTKESSR